MPQLWDDPQLWTDLVDIARRILADTQLPAADTSGLQGAITDLQALVPSTEKRGTTS